MREKHTPDEIAASLTKSEQYVIIGGVTYSAAQRNRLIAKGIAPETCRGARSMHRGFYESYHWAVPLTPLGQEVKDILLGRIPTQETQAGDVA